MDDQMEKLIKRLNEVIALNEYWCADCAPGSLLKDTLQMLNPVRPKELDYDAYGHKYYCGNCNFKIWREDNYCRNCGRKVAWNG